MACWSDLNEGRLDSQSQVLGLRDYPPSLSDTVKLLRLSELGWRINHRIVGRAFQLQDKCCQVNSPLCTISGIVHRFLDTDNGPIRGSQYEGQSLFLPPVRSRVSFSEVYRSIH